MRRAAKVDATHAAVVGAFRACGCLVESLAAVGNGVCDLLVFHLSTRRFLLVEVKDGGKAPSARRLTPAQVAWKAKGWPVIVVDSVEGAIAALRA